ncbi:transcription factor bHLH30-like [Magnolia sinica]|uniref:transcription factor bHLH30-like n=1 Tax=Magnolia sinica TaxID=86752 RepID=UPI00265A497F|nr:transcription factor bHLH30-like [Magnolia sinica]XP_058100760.1 transcription factor bHLH30-like [Magnolia sinica]XP_058100761.1 transcription factor bHLH30-like [Magnolia sinica]
MGSFTGNFGIVYGSDVTSFSGEFWQNLGFRSTARGSLSSSSSSLVLDSERGELVKAPVRFMQKGIAEAKAKAALKNHSEAERRRRERINTHLTTLRNLVPSTDKMDKASLLAEVIGHVKELKRHATEVSNGYIVPTDFDEVRVEPDADGINKGSFSIKASLCCEDRPELLSDLKRTLQALHLKMVRAEISTLGGRVKNVFVMKCEGNANDFEQRIFASSVHQALKAVLDRVASPEFSPRTDLSNKRRRMSLFESSSSSS